MGFDDRDRYQPVNWYPGSDIHFSNFQLPSGSLITYVVLALILIYNCLLYYLDSPITSLLNTLWNAFVYVMPSRVVFAMDPEHPNAQCEDVDDIDDKSLPKLTPSQLHAAKSEAMRRVMGLGGMSIIGRLRSSSISISNPINILRTPKPDAPPGLGNWDNSCYQNSIIQGLASLRSYEKFLDNVEKSRSESSNDNTIVALRDIIRRLNDPSNRGKILWTPSALKSMSSWQQQDAQEYFSKMLDQVEKEAVRQAKCKSNVRRLSGLEILALPLGMSATTTPFGVADCKQVEGSTIANPKMGNPLEGLLAQRVGCTRCGYSEGLSLIPFNCLTVPLGKLMRYDISECLDEYTALEPIEGVECAKCTLLHHKQQIERLLEGIEAKAKERTLAGTPGLTNALRESVQSRLNIATVALENEDFSETSLSRDCQIPKNRRISSIKSRQAVIARPPQALVIHVNRSVFDEVTGAQRKNYADVMFHPTFDLGPWCLGSRQTMHGEEEVEQWNINPSESMLEDTRFLATPSVKYELRAVIIHWGRHENGHYICYRKHFGQAASEQGDTNDSEDATSKERWWSLSDDNVQPIEEEEVLAQNTGVFMLFYERIMEPATPALNMSQRDFEYMLASPKAGFTCATNKREVKQTVSARADSENISSPSSRLSSPLSSGQTTPRPPSSPFSVAATSDSGQHAVAPKLRTASSTSTVLKKTYGYGAAITAQ